RWNAASCLQDQFDSARGVEITRRLAKSRAIDARFSRRSVMKDLQGTDLDIAVPNPGLRGEACTSPPPGRGDESLDGEASPTRCEALERFGIDLGRVGAMTTARTNSRQSLAAPPTEESPRTERSRRARQEGGSKNSSSNKSDGIQTEEGRSRKRNRGGAFATTVTASKDSESSSAAADKLRELNMLLAASEQPLVPPAAMNCGVGAKDDVATVDVQQEPQRAGSDRERAPEERAQTEAPVIPTLNIDGRGSTETLPPKEDTTLKPDAKGLPNHRQVPCDPHLTILNLGTVKLLHPKMHTSRPCWWWMPLLASGAEGISIPDTVTLAPTFLLDENQPTTTTTTTTITTTAATTTAAATAGSRRVALLWAFSGSRPASDNTGELDSTTSKTTLGGILAADGEGELSEAAAAAAAVSSSRAAAADVGYGKDEVNARREQQRLPTTVSSLQRLHTQSVTGDDGLLCAARAICECGRRGGGGAGGDVGGGERSKLPLAVLKIWGRESEEERGRQRSLAGEERRLKRRGRRLRVVSLWTETEVLEALRDMSKGKWGRPTPPSKTTTTALAAISEEANSPTAVPSTSSTVAARSNDGPYAYLSARDEDTCCVQAFVKSAGDTFQGRSEHVSGGCRGAAPNPVPGTGRRRRRTAAASFCGPVFYRALWRRTGKKLLVWKVTSR
ncbi:unnamed protein product, partial [Laminaria digitata]